MMKRTICLLTILAVTLLFSACMRGNGDLNRGANDVRRIALRDNTNTNVNTGYRDGVYVGYGNEHSNRNERAIVTIQNGKIAGINLTNVVQYDISNETNTGTGANNQLGPGTDIRRGSGTPGTTGANPGRMIGGTTGGPGPGSAGGNTGGTTGGTMDGNLGSNTVGPMTGIAGNAINGVRSNLVNLMIQNQRDDVTITNNDTATRTMVSNWKLAVRRALDQAR